MAMHMAEPAPSSAKTAAWELPALDFPATQASSARFPRRFRRPTVKYAIGPTMLTNASAVHIRFEPLIWPAGRRLMSMSVATRRTTSTTPVPTIRLRLRLLRSVSYTHLRAHETVLDLVCRLLLE